MTGDDAIREVQALAALWTLDGVHPADLELWQPSGDLIVPYWTATLEFRYYESDGAQAHDVFARLSEQLAPLGWQMSYEVPGSKWARASLHLDSCWRLEGDHVPR